MQTNIELLAWGLFLQQAVDSYSLNPEALFYLAVSTVLASSVLHHLLKGIVLQTLHFK